jgi:hypothetical protein
VAVSAVDHRWLDPRRSTEKIEFLQSLVQVLEEKLGKKRVLLNDDHSTAKPTTISFRKRSKHPARAIDRTRQREERPLRSSLF